MDKPVQMKQDIKRIERKVWFYLLIASYFLLSYYTFGGWWNSSLGSVFIIFFSYQIWKADFLKMTGLNLKAKTVLLVILVSLLLVSASFYLMKFIAGKHHIIIRFSNWKDYYHDIFYILNEEIVVGAILLFTLTDVKKINPVISSIGLAFIFSIVHYIFYRWIFNDRGIMEYSTLATLFFVGLVRNNLILQFRHIGFSWAIHFGWMSMMFGNSHYFEETNRKVSELERFNLYIGSKEMFTIALLLAIFSFLLWKKIETWNYSSEKTI